MASSRLNPYERFFTLLYSLLGLVMSGARSISWLNNKFQEVVDLPKPKDLKIPGYHEGGVKDVVSWWNDKFPRSGLSITLAIAPFLSTETSFRLEKPRKGILELARKGIFWKEVNGIDVRLHTVDIAELGTNSANEEKYGNWSHWLHEDLKPLIYELKAEYGRYPWDKIHLLSDVIYDRIREGFGRTPFPVPGHWYMKGSPWLSYHMEQNLEATMEYLIGAAVLGIDDFELNPLTELWLSGNLPVGFTKDNKLILMCRK